MNGRSAIAARSAVEALRAGVPNQAAIRLLGTNEGALSQDFLDRLRRGGLTSGDGGQAEGIVVAGAFGAGKSHQLGYFGVLAQQENFIVSWCPSARRHLCSTLRGCSQRPSGLRWFRTPTTTS
jgi:hypothetical protein